MTRLDRDVTLRLQGDWGTANLHRVCGWMADRVLAGSGAGSRVAIWTGTGGLRNLQAVADRSVDISVATPTCAIAMARDGRLWSEPLPSLRALAVIPQVDRLVVAVRADAGVDSFASWREQRAGLRVATAPDDGDSFIGYGARALLAAEGIDGATFVPPESGLLSVFDAVRSGRADALAFEAIMLPPWRELAAEPGLRFLSCSDRALDHLEATLGWPSASIAAGAFPGCDEPVQCLEFSDFLVVCRDDLPDDLAYLIASSLVETRASFEAQYRHLPPERSPVTYPLDPARMGTSPIPLHPGAAAYFDQLAADR
jgi:TRAP-type uncharacterized transport system substrate-binding protein